MADSNIDALLSLATKYARAESNLRYAKRVGMHSAAIDANRIPRDKARAKFKAALQAAFALKE